LLCANLRKGPTDRLQPRQSLYSELLKNNGLCIARTFRILAGAWGSRFMRARGPRNLWSGRHRIA